jgi:hypothetical protein
MFCPASTVYSLTCVLQGSGHRFRGFLGLSLRASSKTLCRSSHGNSIQVRIWATMSPMYEPDGSAAPRSYLTIFLCGPITGVSIAAAKDWRRNVTQALDSDAQLIDPTRDVPDVIRRSSDISTQSLTAEVCSTASKR